MRTTFIVLREAPTIRRTLFVPVSSVLSHSGLTGDVTALCRCPPPTRLMHVLCNFLCVPLAEMEMSEAVAVTPQQLHKSVSFL